MIGRLIGDVVQTLEDGEKINLLIDKFLPKSQIRGFNNYIDYKIPENQIKIEHPDSKVNDGIQAIHIVVKGINKFYRDNDSTYYDIISNRIVTSIENIKISL